MATDHAGTAEAERRFNFSPGPAVLPLEVLQRIQRELVCLPGVGSSVLEISHRSAAFDAILDSTRRELAGLLGLPETHEILFLQGGANLQFSMVPMNLLRGQGSPAGYLLTGTWGAMAAAEAAREGEVRVLWDGRDTGYDRLPEEGIEPPGDLAYLHFTSNETIQGVQWKQLPQCDSPLVCDCSSDFLSRPIDVARHGLIYACAQKNAGIAGVTVIIVRRDLLHRSGDTLPKMLSYQVHAEKGSRANTPPVFAIYVLGLLCEWIRESFGGLESLATHNAAKAGLLYDEIDASGGFYLGHARTTCRSEMNVTFRLADEGREREFLEAAAARGLVELKGHRSVGGIRASVYNAMPLEGVERLRDFMAEFRGSAKAASTAAGSSGETC
jgi:phosphoserine aminotransferase